MTIRPDWWVDTVPCVCGHSFHDHSTGVHDTWACMACGCLDYDVPEDPLTNTEVVDRVEPNPTDPS